MPRSGYVLAGFETLATILDNYMNGKKGRYFDNFTREDISKFLSATTYGFLHSYGQNFPGKKNYKNYNKSEAGLFQKCRDLKLFDNCTLIADSGGFQISIGRLTRTESDLLTKMYYEWIENYHEVFDRAFILDVPPGPGCEIFHDFSDVYKLNLESYLRAKNLPDEVRKKIIYIHHFRTPKLWEIYTKIMRENEMFPAFEYHGTGGVVANMSGDMSIPCIIYVLPLIPLLNECKKYKRNYLNFHILGGANFRDILFYELFKLVVKKKHDIDLNITYDSSGIYKQVMHARFMHVKNEYNNLEKLDIRTKKLNMRFGSKSTVMETYQHILNDLSNKWDFKKICLDGVYCDNSGTFHEDVKVYSILYILDLYSQIQYELKKHSKIIYNDYENKNMESFYNHCMETTQMINQGKLTKKQKVKATSIPKSLDMLAELDEEYCQYIVDKVLSKDEFLYLEEKTQVLKI